MRSRLLTFVRRQRPQLDALHWLAARADVQSWLATLGRIG